MIQQILILILLLTNTTFSAIKPTALTCEYTKNPTVVDVLKPRLAWINIADENELGQEQTAYQIRVATTKEKLKTPDLWDSEKVNDNNSTRVIYDGKELSSRQDCWWQVRVWDKDRAVSEWSEPAKWHMGILNEDEWEAEWIGAPWQGEETLEKQPYPGDRVPRELPPPAPMLRKDFSIEKEIQTAVAYVTGLGYFEFYVNGEKVGDDVLVPNQTNYGKREGLLNQNIPLPDDFRAYKVMYLAYDIKEKLQQGENAIGSILGNGFYNPSKYWAEGYGSPRFISQIHITYSDGEEEIIVSDESWKASKSPIVMDMVYFGEYYDARLEQDGWSTANFDDSKWKNVVIREAPFGKLVAHTAHPDKVVERIKPISIERMYNGNYLIDFGEEVSGWVKLNNVEAPAGHKIEIKYLSNIFSGDNSYIFRGEGKETYAARFNWFIFRQVEIVNWEGELSPEQVTAEVVYTYIEESAKFETSNQMFNDINKIWRRSQTDNMHGGIASDCPHRERSAYTGDGQVACVTVMENYDARNFYQKWIHDIIDAQVVETGYVPNGAPWQPGCGGGVAWGAAICIMPWEFYKHYGSIDMLQDSYHAMKEYIRYMNTWIDEEGIMYSKRTGRDGKILKWFNLGEWVAPNELPRDELVHTFYYWRCADITSKVAKILGDESEYQYYKNLANNTADAFHKRFYDTATGSYGNAGSNIFALKMGVPENQYSAVIKSIEENLKNNNGHFDTGIFGTRYFFEVLSENGMHDLAYQAMNKKDEPSFGRWLKLGATTTWEKWNTEGSHNHPMFGGGLSWYYRNLAGMKPDPGQPGFRHIIFKPQIVDDLEFVKYFNNTAYGESGIHWRNEEAQLSIDIKVAVGCTASLYVPTTNTNAINISSIANDSVELYDFVEMVDIREGHTIYKVKSGDYSFSIKN